MKPTFNYTLPVTIFREGDAFVAYTPALDLSSAGKTKVVARKMLAEAVEILFEELTESGNLDLVLMELGWTKVRGNLVPPQVVEHAMVDIKVPAVA